MTYTTAVCTVNDGQRNCPKQVQLHSKNKFEKLVHLVGFYYRNAVAMCYSQMFLAERSLTVKEQRLMNRVSGGFWCWRLWTLRAKASAPFPTVATNTRQTMYYNATLRHVRVTIVAVERQWVLHNVCLQPYISNMNCACAILSSAACPAVQYPTLSHKRHDSPGGGLNRNVYFDFLYNFCLKQF
jgi:hypothetical protein